MGVISSALIILNYALSGNANDVFWTLFSFASIVFMLNYLFMFPAAIKLRFTDDAPRQYAVPGGKAGIVVCGVICFLCVALACYFLIDFDVTGYAFWMQLIGVLLTVAVGYWLYRAGKKKELRTKPAAFASEGLRMKTRKIAAVVLCVLSVVAIICFRLISAPLTGAVTAAELGSALGALSLLPTVLSVALAFLLGDVVVSLLIGLSVGELMLLLVTGEKGAAQLLQIVPSVIDELVGVASDTENTKVLILCALVGGLVGVLMKTGGFEAAAKRITKK